MKRILESWTRWFFFRTAADRMLVVSMIFSGFLVLTRVAVTHKLSYIFLIWNLFLAYVPYVLTTCLAMRSFRKVEPLRFAFFFTVWLLFIPNAFYILTDLYHLRSYSGVPLWFDLALLGSFAWNGLLLGILSVQQMEKYLQPYMPGKTELFFICPLMCLNAFGVYIGRYLRFNSWDVITNPFELMGDTLYIIIHPFRNMYGWGMIICYSVFMTLIYLTIKRISKTIY